MVGSIVVIVWGVTVTEYSKFTHAHSSCFFLNVTSEFLMPMENLFYEIICTKYLEPPNSYFSIISLFLHLSTCCTDIVWGESTFILTAWISLPFSLDKGNRSVRYSHAFPISRKLSWIIFASWEDNSQWWYLIGDSSWALKDINVSIHGKIETAVLHFLEEENEHTQQHWTVWNSRCWQKNSNEMLKSWAVCFAQTILCPVSIPHKTNWPRCYNLSSSNKF